jgi:hypothetical protein
MVMVEAPASSAAEDIGKAQDVVDLVGVVGAAGRHDGVVAHGLDVFGRDLRIRVGQRQDDGLGGHLGDHVLLEHAAGRQAQEDVRAGDHVAERARVGLLRELDLVLVHQLGAAFIDHAGQVGHEHVFALNAQLEQQVQAGQRRGARAGGHQLDLARPLADHLERVQHRRAHGDGRAVLVVVEHRDLHALAQLALHVEAVGRLDVFEVDGAEGRLQRGNDVDQFGRVFFVDLDVEHVDAGELLEQHALAFHHRLGGQRADVAQAQHGGAVGDHGHQVAAAGVLEGVVRVLDDFFAGRRDAGGISQGQVALVGQLFGRCDGHLAGGRKLVVLKCGAAQFGTFFFAVGFVVVGRRGGGGRHQQGLQRKRSGRPSIFCKVCDCRPLEGKTLVSESTQKGASLVTFQHGKTL